MTGGHRIGIVAAVLAIIGALAPWNGDGAIVAWGYQGPGWFIVVPAAVALIAMVAVRAPRVKAWVAGFAMGVAAIVSLAAFFEMAPPIASAGLMSWGLPLAMAASVIGLVAVLYGNASETAQREERASRA